MEIMKYYQLFTIKCINVSYLFFFYAQFLLFNFLTNLQLTDLDFLDIFVYNKRL